jgi:hypothetical protein
MARQVADIAAVGVLMVEFLPDVDVLVASQGDHHQGNFATNHVRAGRRKNLPVGRTVRRRTLPGSCQRPSNLPPFSIDTLYTTEYNESTKSVETLSPAIHLAEQGVRNTNGDGACRAGETA